MDRRQFLGVGAGVLTTALAGCAGGAGGDDATTGATRTGTDESTSADSTTEEPTTDEPTEEAATDEPTSYSVSMAPVGEVAFDAVPETFVAYESGYADMAVALGMGDGLAGIGYKARYHTDVYDELDGVSVDEEAATQLLGDSYAIDKETFYEIDADVHLIDPQWLVQNGFFKLGTDDVETVSEDVAPFVGNTIFRRTDAWHDYRYYTLYEAFETVATVFQREDRYEAFEAFHDGVVAEVQSDLPPSNERPAAALVWAGENEPEEFTPYYLSGKGTNKKQFRDLGVRDAIASTDVEAHSSENRGKIDYETLLEIDPDALLVRGHEDKSAEEFRNTVGQFLRDHEVASGLTAVENEMVFRGGPVYQGPIHHLFNLERFATALFPEAYSGELFDRSELAAIVRGEF